MSDAQKFRTMDWIVGVATLFAVGLTTWNFVTTSSNDTRITVIEQTRFTAEDAETLIQPKLDLIIQKMEHIGRDLQRLEDKIDE